MNKTMSDCCAFWALYICLNENGQYKKEEEAQNWLDWMEELAEKEDESQRTEREPDVVMHWHSHTWTTINPPPKNSGDVNLYYAPPQRTWAGLTDDEINASSKGHITRNGFARAIEVKLKEKNCAG
jgi:hypothetical protein